MVRDFLLLPGFFTIVTNKFTSNVSFPQKMKTRIVEKVLIFRDVYRILILVLPYYTNRYSQVHAILRETKNSFKIRDGVISRCSWWTIPMSMISFCCAMPFFLLLWLVSGYFHSFLKIAGHHVCSENTCHYL